jgi:hypothetical protein
MSDSEQHAFVGAPGSEFRAMSVADLKRLAAARYEAISICCLILLFEITPWSVCNLMQLHQGHKHLRIYRERRFRPRVASQRESACSSSSSSTAAMQTACCLLTHANHARRRSGVDKVPLQLARADHANTAATHFAHFFTLVVREATEMISLMGNRDSTTLEYGVERKFPLLFSRCVFGKPESCSRLENHRGEDEPPASAACRVRRPSVAGVHHSQASARDM